MVALAGTGWVLAPSLVAYVAEVDERFPDRDHTSDGSIGDADHASRESDHNPCDGFVHAVDIDEDLATGVDLAPLWAHLIAQRDPRIRYLIYEGQIVKSYRDPAGHTPWVPYPYTGINDHAHHLHLSIDRTDTARQDTRPWGVAVAYPTSQPTLEEDPVYKLAWLKAPDKPGALYRVLFATGKDGRKVPVEAYDVPSNPDTIERWRGRLDEVPSSSPIPANTFIRIMDGPYRNVGD